MKHTIATKKKLSKMRKGKNNPFWGHKHTPEALKKMGNNARIVNAKRQYTRRPSRIKLPLGIDIGYLAGIIDGEGSIGFHGRGTPYVSIYNTSLLLMKWLIHEIGGSFGGHDKRGRMLSYTWGIQAINDVLTLLYIVKNHLIIKKEKAEKVIKILENRYGKNNNY